MPVAAYTQSSRRRSNLRETSSARPQPRPPTSHEPDTDTDDPEQEELIKAYARLLRDGVTGLNSALNSWLELVPSSSRRASHQGLIAFGEAATRVALERDNLESLIRGAIDSYRHVAGIGDAIREHIGTLRDFVQAFIRYAWDKVKDLAKDLLEHFRDVFNGLKDGLFRFVSWVFQAVPAPTVMQSF